MPKEQTSSTDKQVDFNIKHRLVGAGVLIFFGVLVLPWMLGPPDSNVGGQQAHAARQSALDEAVNSEIVDFDDGFFEGVESEETVYISKITPLDGQQSSNKNSTVSPKQNQAPNQVPNQVPNKDAKANIVDNGTDVSAVRPEAASTPKDSNSNAVATAPLTNLKKPIEDSASLDNAAKEPASVVSVKQQSSNSSSNSTKVIAAAPAPSIDVGWVVQVGLFSTIGYEARAKTLVSELVGDGFKADSTVVETNRGKGMRVWLGPFAKRTDANKEVERLKGVTGKDGFVRVYP